MSPSPCVTQCVSMPIMAVARCNSYTTFVHQDVDISPLHQTSLNSLVQCVVEWLVILQRLEEERKLDMPPVSCRCNKAVKINEELKSVSKSLIDMCRVSDRLGCESQVSPHQLDTIGHDIVRLADLLRADVSILIPSTVGRAEPSVAEQARNIVTETDCVQSLVGETVECVTKLVFSLMSVHNCQHCSSPGQLVI